MKFVEFKEGANAEKKEGIGGGGRIRTCGLQVMSLTSYRAALPRDKTSLKKLVIV